MQQIVAYMDNIAVITRDMNVKEIIRNIRYMLGVHVIRKVTG